MDIFLSLLFFFWNKFNINFRWKSGVASSLNYVNIESKESSPALMPYPSWEANSLDSDGTVTTADTTGGRTNAPKATASDSKLADNSSIISTFRIRVDECDRLWVMMPLSLFEQIYFICRICSQTLTRSLSLILLGYGHWAR